MHDPTTTHSPPRRSRAGRVAAIVTAGVLGLVAFGFLAAGGVLLWADGEKDAQGFLSTDSEPYATRTAALATENLDLDLDGAGWITSPDRFGRVRLEVSPHGDKPVFVGIAPTRDVAAYLRGTAHTTVTDVDYSPFDADYRDAPGARRAAPPSGQSFWSASASGRGKQTLEWDVTDGDWSVVAMNADGSPGVDVGVRAGAKVPFLSGLGWGLLGGGVLLLAGAGALLFVGVRRPRTSAAPVPVAA